MYDLTFYRGKHVLVTGHTGFKGAWMCQMLSMAGAEVTGYALAPPAQPNVFEMINLPGKIHSVIGDIRDLERLHCTFRECRPEIVIHMAAQPLVRYSYKEPVYTYDTNVMGTVNVLECVRTTDSARSVINVTTDKVYCNKEWDWPYRESDELDGYDPYSNSKSCSELVTNSYKKCFFHEQDVAVSTVRAGNVIGGGDFSADRIIPDCVRAAECGKEIFVRNPDSMRPYQHVLEALAVYLMVAQFQYKNIKYSGCYNIGPDDKECVTTKKLVTLFCRQWKEKTGKHVTWSSRLDIGPHEANVLKLDCSRLKNVFGWEAKWNFETALERTVEWYICQARNANVEMCMERQIREFLESGAAANI